MMTMMVTRLRIEKKSMCFHTRIDLLMQLYYMLIYETISSWKFGLLICFSAL